MWFYLYHDSIKYNSIFDILKTPTYLGYGSFYWFIIKIFAFWLIRVINVSLLLSTCYALYLIMKHWRLDLNDFYLASFFTLCAPLTWFTEKIIGPELLGYGIDVWGLTSVYN